MEFFEFDNSFISDKGSQTTSLNTKNPEEGFFIYGDAMTCAEVQEFKDQKATLSYSKGLVDCVKDMPNQVKPGNTPGKASFGTVNTSGARKFK